MASGHESVQQLFAKYSVGEIRELEKKTRNEIETKKEDLRQMVGERYRDLIEAADTITEMKRCASEMKESVQRLQQYTSTELGPGKLKASRMRKKSNMNTLNTYMQLSAQVKLLMEMSETIWSRVEGGNMIEATHLYLQSRQVLKNLNLDGSTTYCPILQWFPVLGQQAQALDNLRSTILSECRQLLQDSNLNAKPISEALCSVILLEGTDVTKAFSEFMEARFSAIESRFESESFTSADDTGSARLCKVVTLLVATLKQAHSLFVTPVKVKGEDARSDQRKRSSLSLPREQKTDSGLVAHMLRESYKSFAEKCTDYEKVGSVNEERLWCRHLPESVSKLTTLQLGDVDPVLNASRVQQTCQDWLSKCNSTIRNGTLKLLSYVPTFRGLAALRQSIWDTLNEVSDPSTAKVEGEEGWKVGSLESGDTQRSEWEEACLATLGRRLLLWDEVLKDLFLDKVNSLSETLFNNLLNNARKNLDEVLRNLLTCDHSRESTNQFIWNELPGDVLPETAWKQVSLHRGQEVKGGLGLKALTVTPILHKTCMQLNASMKQVLTDLFHYIPDVRQDEKKGQGNKNWRDIKATPAVEKEERRKICSSFQQSCSHCLREFLACLSSYEGSLNERLTMERSSIDEILFLAMFCKNFCHLCFEFEVGCKIGEDTFFPPLKKQLSNPGGSMSSSMLLHSLHPSSSSPIWEEMTSKMLAQSQKFLQMWSEATIEKAISKFGSEMLNLKHAANLFDTMPTWDHVAIQEESETGSKVESEIKLPMTVSWPILELLHSVCESISKVGGHSMSRSTLQDITGTCLDGVLYTYTQLRESVTKIEKATNEVTDTNDPFCGVPFTPTQLWALQKLFDLRMLHGLLHSSIPPTGRAMAGSADRKYRVGEDSFSELVDWLESYIDPFDLDVFAPHLTKNIQRSIHCSAVMLGFITPSDKSESLHSSHSTMKSGGNSHNILPLATDCGRFSYLPISNRMSKSESVSLPASIKNKLPLSSALQQIADADRKMSGTDRKQSLYSKLGALSSSWLSMATSET